MGHLTIRARSPWAQRPWAGTETEGEIKYTHFTCS